MDIKINNQKFFDKGKIKNKGKSNLLKTKIKIVHVINPYKCPVDNPSYLYYAQPITFKSMHVAQLEANKHNIEIELYSINFPEDDEVVPDYFLKLPHLIKSTLTEFPDISKQRKLPIIQEIFDSTLENTEFDFIVFTNSDIGLQKNFYIKIYDFILKDNLQSFVINRRDNIPKFILNKRVTEKDLDLIYKENGILHKGKDCFVISREILKIVNMHLLFTGCPPWGDTLYKILKKINPETYLFKNEYLTFHLGKGESWAFDKKDKLFLKNNQISRMSLSWDVLIKDDIRSLKKNILRKPLKKLLKLLRSFKLID